MKVTNFPLLDLPPIIIQKSLRKLNALDLFEFSAISPIHLQLVKSTPNLASSNSTINAELAFSEMIQVSVMTKDADALGVWSLEEDDIPKNVKKDKKYNKTINGIEMKIERKSEEDATVYTPSDLKYASAVMGYLSDLLKIPFGEIMFDIQHKEISEVQCVIDVIKECEKLTLVSHRKQHSNEDIVSMLNSMQVTKELEFLVNPNPNFKFPEYLLKINTLNFGYSDWITRKMLLSMDCEIIKMEECTLKADDMKAFVNQWFNSTNMKLQCLELIMTEEYKPFDIKAFKAKKFDSKVRSDTHKFCDDDTSDGMDIVRKDGVLATIVQREEEFKFLVWHDRFPKDDDDEEDDDEDDGDDDEEEDDEDE